MSGWRHIHSTAPICSGRIENNFPCPPSPLEFQTSARRYPSVVYRGTHERTQSIHQREPLQFFYVNISVVGRCTTDSATWFITLLSRRTPFFCPYRYNTIRGSDAHARKQRRHHVTKEDKTMHTVLLLLQLDCQNSLGGSMLSAAKNLSQTDEFMAKKSLNINSSSG
jgi:hypothetical protein